jgi:hypothetical protein
MSDSYGLDNYTNEDRQRAISRLNQSSPLVPTSGAFIGHRYDGRTIWLPGSYLAGYRSFLAGNSLTIVSDFFGLGLAGQLSDGTIAYLPSFRDGIRDAQNDLRNALLVEAQRRTFIEIENIKRQADDAKRKDEEEKREMQQKITELSDKVAKLEKKSEEKKQG